LLTGAGRGRSHPPEPAASGIEECAKAGRGGVVRQAAPVDGSISRDEGGGTAVTDDAVSFDGGKW
jgi:hypothetical protein